MGSGVRTSADRGAAIDKSESESASPTRLSRHLSPLPYRQHKDATDKPLDIVPNRLSGVGASGRIRSLTKWPSRRKGMAADISARASNTATDDAMVMEADTTKAARATVNTADHTPTTGSTRDGE